MRLARRWMAVGGAAAALAAATVVPGAATSSDPGPREETETALAAAETATAPTAVAPAAPAVAPAAKEPPTLTRIGNHPGSTGGHVSREGNRLYVGAYGIGFRIFSLADPANPELLGEYTAWEADNKHARADAVPDATVLGGRHIVAFGGTRRLTQTNQRTDVAEFVDVTDPARPVLLARFEGPDDGESHNSDIVDKRALWLPTGGANRADADGNVVAKNGLRIYDLRPLVAKKAGPPKLIGRWDPVELWEKSPHRRGREVGPVFTHSHDVTVYVDHPVSTPAGVVKRDIALLAEGGNYTGNGNTGSIFVIDITDPRNPVVRNRWLHEAGDGHHPIRYFHEAQLLDGDRSVMIVTDEDLHSGCNAGGATIVSLSPDLTSATELSEWFIGLGTPAPVCSTHVFSSLGKQLYIGSYNAGLQVVDLTNPRKPTRVAQDQPPGANSWGALVHKTKQGTFVYLGDFGARGLDVYKVS